jgi:hypothetical protein
MERIRQPNRKKLLSENKTRTTCSQNTVRFRIAALTVTALLFALAYAPLANATSLPMHGTTATLVTGQSTASNEVATVVGTSGNLVFESITSQLSFTGGMVGTGPATAFAIINTATGHIVFTEQALFTGTIMGSQSGSVIILISGSGSLTGGTQAHDLLVHGTGGLAGIQAKGTQATAAGSSTTSFSLWVHLDSN